ncbi:MAG: tripartite tricarboxylate transporter substrate binding protein [Betaproteobacteria bacterium]|nr:tripartite tricarboxylate transporter substrate binding protein [Betaproteobacteria bacterium]
MVVPFAPSGISDIFARMIGQKLAEALGQAVVIDNRAGAGGNLGTELVARATADGYTLLFVATAFGISPSLYRRPGYDPVRDFAAVAQVASGTNLVVVAPNVPARSAKELIALARAKPGQLNYGSGGVGTSGQLAVELFKISAGVDLVHIPYKGAGLAVTALLSGEVQVMFAPLTLVLPHVNAGKLRPIAVTSMKRSTAAPNVPTIAETAVPDFDVSAWFGIVAPVATPRRMVEFLHREVDKILRLPEVQERIANQGAEATSRTPQEFRNYIAAEVKKWSEVVKRAGIAQE